jgi:hypothetical protein
VLYVGPVAPWAGKNLQLTLTHSLTHSRTHALRTAAAAAATEFALLLLIALLEIVLLMLPEEHTDLSFKQREAWWGSLPIARRRVGSTWALPPAS